jgi:hypothetical protein
LENIFLEGNRRKKARNVAKREDPVLCFLCLVAANLKMQNFTSIPFKSDKHDGLSVVNGIAKFSSAGVVLEFESKLFGIISDGVKEARIAVSDILDIKFMKGLFKRGAKIQIRTKSLSVMAGLPNNDGKLTLKLKRDDFERAKDAVEKLLRNMSETAAALPPVQTPVSQLFEDAGEEETRDLKK